MLSAVKSALGITGTYQNATIQFYINDINQYLADAGVPAEKIGTEATAGAVARGVADLWNYGAGEGKLSPYFYERAIQLSAADAETEE